MSPIENKAFKKLISNMRLSSRRRYHVKPSTTEATVNITRKYAIEVTPEDLKNIYERQGGRCFWLGVKVDPASIFTTNNTFAMSVDRLDTEKDYTKDNCVITLRLANLGRQAMPVELWKANLKSLKAEIAENHVTCRPVLRSAF